MTSTQKVIKYLALAFAIFLIINIFGGIFVMFRLGLPVIHLGGHSSNNTSTITKSQIFEENDSALLDINLRYANLKIVNGDRFSAETNDDEINISQNDNKIMIEDKNDDWFTNDDDRTITIYVPEDLVFDKVDIDNGAGKSDIDFLNAKEFIFNMGAGKVNINNLIVTENTKFEGGAGKVEINNGSVNNFNLDMGAGKLSFNGKITGSSKISAGVGKLNIDLNDSIDNYTIDADKGIGSFTINNKSVSDHDLYGNGANDIKVDGGVGSIEITTRN